jgi:hypothetical protein
MLMRRVEGIISGIFAKRKRLLMGIGGLFILILFVLFNKENIFLKISNAFKKGRPAYIVVEKRFKSIKSAQRYIKEIPFVVPQKIKTSYKLRDITYSKTKENSCSVAFQYKDDNNNELWFEYYSKGENSILYSKRLYFEVPKYVIRAQLSYSPGTNATDESDNEMLAGIIDGFLHSEIFYAKTENDIIFDSLTLRFNSF